MWNLMITTHKKEIVEINPNPIEIMVPYRFMMGSWLGISGLTLVKHSL